MQIVLRDDLHCRRTLDTAEVVAIVAVKIDPLLLFEPGGQASLNLNVLAQFPH